MKHMNIQSIYSLTFKTLKKNANSQKTRTVSNKTILKAEICATYNRYDFMRLQTNTYTPCLETGVGFEIADVFY